jgi:protein-disulfide isomerase
MAVSTTIRSNMNTKAWYRRFPFLFVFWLFVILGIIDTVQSQDDEVIATLNGEPITLAEVKENVAFQVYRLQGNIYLLLKRETEEIVNQKLLTAEAARRGLTVDELLRKEVEEKVPPLGEKEVDKYLAEQPGDTVNSEQKRNRIRTYLSQRAVAQRRLNFISALRDKADFRFMINPPQHPRTKIDIEGEPWRGNPDAPITLVHFANFNCTLCVETVKMIQRVMDEYPGQIKWVHRNFFGIRDEKALTAAQLGESAHEQGRFWKYHDLMFSLGGDFEMEELQQIFKTAGLNQKIFEEGEKSGRFLLKVKEDIKAASRIGVTGVPVIFVNGLYFGGTFPYDQLIALVIKERNHSNESLHHQGSTADQQHESSDK